jgi:pyrroloquinoline-quinone synthase
MELKYRLLDHPFYQAWTKGEVTKEQLAKYHQSYSEFIELMPQYWDKINKAFNQNSAEADSIVQDEASHIKLWADWSHKLPVTQDYPHMSELIGTMNQMTPSELLGAVQAFETQQPEVAATKKAGLLEFYGFEESETKYFDEHMEEEEHISYGNTIREKHANQEEYKAGFDKGAELFYKGLDLFVSC